MGKILSFHSHPFEHDYTWKSGEILKHSRSVNGNGDRVDSFPTGILKGQDSDGI